MSVSKMNNMPKGAMVSSIANSSDAQLEVSRTRTLNQKVADSSSSPLSDIAYIYVVL